MFANSHLGILSLTMSFRDPNVKRNPRNGFNESPKELIIAIIEKTIGPLSMMDGGPIQAKDRVCKFQRELKPGPCKC